MDISLKVVYDTEGNFKVTEDETGDSIEYGEIDTDGEVATVRIRLQLPEINSRTIEAKIPQSDESDGVARVTVE